MRMRHNLLAMHHVIPLIELIELLERHHYLACARAIGTKRIFVVAVENLVVGITTEFQIVIDKPFVQRFKHRSKIDFITPIVENSGNTVGLFLAVAQNVDAVSLSYRLHKTLTYQIEVFVKERLYGGTKFNFFVIGKNSFIANFHFPKVTNLLYKQFGCHQ